MYNFVLLRYNLSFYGKNMSLLHQVTTLNRDLPEYDIKKDHHTVMILEHFKQPDSKDEEYYAVEILHTQQIVAIPASFINPINPITTMTSPISSTSQLSVTITTHYISNTKAELTIMLPTDEENDLHPLLVNKNYIVGGHLLVKRWGEYKSDINKRIIKDIFTFDSSYCVEDELLPILRKEIAKYIEGIKTVLTTVKSKNILPPDEIVEFEI